MFPVPLARASTLTVFMPQQAERAYKAVEVLQKACLFPQIMTLFVGRASTVPPRRLYAKNQISGTSAHHAPLPSDSPDRALPFARRRNHRPPGLHIRGRRQRCAPVDGHAADPRSDSQSFQRTHRQVHRLRGDVPARKAGTPIRGHCFRQSQLGFLAHHLSQVWHAPGHSLLADRFADATWHPSGHFATILMGIFARERRVPQPPVGA
jgi:hypothetical protein